MSRFLADCTHNRLTGIPNTHRIITNRHRRWNWITKRHLKMTGAIGHRRKITKITEWMTPKDLNEDWTSQSGTSNGRSLTKTEQMDRSGAVTSIGTSPKRKEDPSRRSSQYSAVLHVTRTRPFLRNCTAHTLAGSKALGNCGAISATPVDFLQISSGR